VTHDPGPRVLVLGDVERATVASSDQGTVTGIGRVGNPAPLFKRLQSALAGALAFVTERP
jgi:hypothetical protein